MKPCRSTSLVVLLCLALVACGSRVNQENYEKVRNDMSVEQVNDILGKPTEVSSIGIGGLSATTSQWKGKTHSILVTFANDRVKMKTYTKNENVSKDGKELDK